VSETYRDYSKMIDHSLLQPMLTASELELGCRLAIAYEVASVCILPYFLQRCSQILEGTGVLPSTTIGFPHGGHAPQIKQLEAIQAIADGGQELDMVVNISQVLSGQWTEVRREIESVLEPTHAAGRKLKVIFENCYLQDSHKIRLCEICGELGVDWVKTSTGYGTGGATMEDLRLMRHASPAAVQVKAAGGVKDFESLKEVRKLGATRCGTSRTQSILDTCRSQMGLPAIVFQAADLGGY
jgi:deoxyribose-phosphate aldolase